MTGPDGERFEYYVVLADAEDFGGPVDAGDPVCCTAGAGIA